MTTLKNLKSILGVNSLLSSDGSNPKVAKNGKVGVSGAVLHLAPADRSGYEVCPMRSAGCTAACLHTAGNPAYMQQKEKSRLAKTIAFFDHRQEFMNLLAYEIQRHVEKAEANNMIPAIRLNGTSDIRWEAMRFDVFDWVSAKLDSSRTMGVTIMDLFPITQFYDYTKIPNRKHVPNNYYLTFSLNETNREFATQQKRNIAVVFRGALPDEYLGRPVIDGDEHDYRPNDPANVVVGLKVKGSGRKDETGFVVEL